MVFTEERTVGLMSGSCAPHRQVLVIEWLPDRVSLSGEIDFSPASRLPVLARYRARLLDTQIFRSPAGNNGIAKILGKEL